MIDCLKHRVLKEYYKNAAENFAYEKLKEITSNSEEKKISQVKLVRFPPGKGLQPAHYDVNHYADAKDCISFIVVIPLLCLSLTY